MSAYDVLRRFPRIPSSSVIRLAPVDDYFKEEVAQTQVIGGGGCQFTFHKSYGLDTLLTVQLKIGGKEISPIAKVVWEKVVDGGDYAVGLEFIVISAEEHKALGDFVSRRLGSGEVFEDRQGSS